MKLITIFIFLQHLVISTTNAQPDQKKEKLQTRVLFKSSDLCDSGRYQTVVKIRETWGRLGKYITAIDSSGNKNKFRKKSIWGYKRAKDDYIKRVFGGETYLVKEVSEVVVYKQYVRHGSYFFSKSFDSPVIRLTRKKLLKAIGAEALLNLCRQSEFIRENI